MLDRMEPAVESLVAHVEKYDSPGAPTDVPDTADTDSGEGATP